MDEFKLTDLQQAILLLVKAGKDDELHKNWNKQVDSLLKLDLIQYKPNSNEELMLTLKGEDCIVKSILVKYPMHNRGDVGNYNKVVSSMDDAAINALICTLMNERAFDRIPKQTARVLGQHFLDVEFYKKWGSVLIGKWLIQCKTSMKFFAEMENKNGKEDKSIT
jgi:hypothetical protein